jgi:hypothetical protein
VETYLQPKRSSHQTLPAGRLPTTSATEQSDPYALDNLTALSREWNGTDYKVIAAAIDAKTIPLPRYSHESGAKILKRMTATENLAFVQDKELPIDNRYQEILTIAPATQSILQAYTAAADRGEKVNAELAALMAFCLHLSAAFSTLADELLPTIPQDDRYAVRMGGLLQTRYGIAKMFLGAAISLSETHFYSGDDVSLILAAMADTLPTVKNSFTPDFRSEIRKKLEEYRNGMTKSNDIRNLDRMIAEL